MLVARGEGDPDGDQGEEDELPATAQAERPAVRQLDEVVEEADRAAAERDEQDGEGRHLVLADGEKRDGGDDEDQQAAHRRRALLGAVMLRPLGTDVLAERVAAQKVDEPRTDEDRDHHRDDGGDEDADQCVGAPASASATASSPTARDALTSTASPGWTTSSSSRTASWTFATQRPVTPLSR